MPSTQDLRRKIKSVKATGKLTRAMQMVAASKMNRATAAAVASRAYAAEAWAILSALSARTQISHPLFASVEGAPSAPEQSPLNHSSNGTVGRQALIVITSNRGLAGSLNTQVIRVVTQNISESIDLVTIGRKGAQFFRRFHPDRLVADFPASDATPHVSEVTPVATLVVDGFRRGTYAGVSVAYTHFVSTLAQEPRLLQLLPIVTDKSYEWSKRRSEVTIEPDPVIVLDMLATKIVPLRLYQCLLESSASEHSARMLAMKNATDNARDIVDDLTLVYQGVRQANITRQIIEVSAGANALAG
ncbi:ATP synthase F1 subunit gamma [Candidatus Berkelbacteria bacterium]|nr:ATP synthase F1 subunit gamma [Candidatus Berkelbacteria bacterium]